MMYSYKDLSAVLNSDVDLYFWIFFISRIMFYNVMQLLLQKSFVWKTKLIFGHHRW